MLEQLQPINGLKNNISFNADDLNVSHDKGNDCNNVFPKVTAIISNP